MNDFADALRSLSDFNTEILSKPIPSSLQWADTQFEIIKRHVIAFRESLDNEHDVALQLTNFGSSVVMEVTEIGYDGSVLMVFRGYVNGTFSTLIQHVSQLNFLLTTVSKDPEQPRRSIGFTSRWEGQ